MRKLILLHAYVTAVHVISQFTEMYGSMRTLACKFRDFKLQISRQISGFRARFQDFEEDFSLSVRDFKVVADPSLQAITVLGLLAPEGT